MTSTQPVQTSKWMRWLMAINLGLVALQPVSAGFFLSGFDHALLLHRTGAMAVQLGAVIQGVAAAVLWSRGRATGRAAGFSIGLLAMVLLEVWAGRHTKYWLHIPVGVAILVSLRERVRK